MFSKTLLRFSMICLIGWIGLYNGKAHANQTPSKTFMAFSGGGYHAHAGAFGMLVATMEKLNMDMSGVTQNVAALSSNSGGSWFLTQAAYSKKFLTYMNDPYALVNFTSPSGYLGSAYAFISNNKDVCADWHVEVVCRDLIAVLGLKLGKGFAGFLMSGGGQWQTVTEQAVFGGGFTNQKFNMTGELANVSLNGPRNAWAQNKALIVASSILSQQPALTLGRLATIQTLEGSQSQINYQMTPGNTPVVHPPQVPGTAPVMLANVGSSGRTAPNFLPGGDMDLQYGTRVLGRFVKGQYTATLDNPTMTNEVGNLNVIQAASNSSAAGGGFIDIPMLSKTISVFGPGTAVSLNGFAPAFTLNGPFTFISNVGKTVGNTQEKLANAKLVRFADGGFVDNTAVAYMVRHMQDNGDLVDGFNIIAMNNFPGPQYTNSGSTFPTSGDIAALFANPNNNIDTTHAAGLLGFQFVGILSSVFERDAYFTSDGKSARQADWSFFYDGSKATPKSKCQFYLAYTNYPVTTRTNTFFGITQAGVTGNLHVFSVLSAEAAVVPTNQDQMECYTKMLSQLNTSVATEALGTHFQSALGL